MGNLLEKCVWCPWECGADRRTGQGRCGAGMRAKVARAALHPWEEPCISGDKGSGTVFFSHCNLRCVFCQNFRISHDGFGKELDTPELAGLFLSVEALGAHNINLVSGSQYIPQIRDALTQAKKLGLAVPVVWNSNGYDSITGLQLLEGLVDIYLPDLKYSNDDLAYRLSGARNYWRFATGAIREMLRQVGSVEFDGRGLAKKGLIIRHLVLPNHLDESKDVLDWVRLNMPKGVYVSLMAQYTPVFKAKEHPDIDRAVSEQEYQEITQYLLDIGLDNGWIQEPDSASEEYVPPFDLTGIK